MESNSLVIGNSYTILVCDNIRLCELGMCGTKLTLIAKIYKWIFVFKVRGTLIAVRQRDLQTAIFKEWNNGPI